jgi:superfamily II DNA or RNA helicase
VQALFDAIRGACSSSAWSRGVELARAGAVHRDVDRDDEILLRVSTRGGMVSPMVSLYPQQAEWECECPSHEDACEHAAAAVIAMRRAEQGDGTAVSPERSAGTIRYHLSRVEGGLAFERCIVNGDAELPLRHSLDALASGRVDGPRFTATSADVAVERALGSRRRGAMDRASLRRLLEPLARCEDVRLDGSPIRVSSKPVTLHGVLEEADGGFLLSVRPDPNITEHFTGDAVLCGDTLQMTGASRLSGRELADLPSGRFYSYDRVAELATEMLPSLEARIPVEIRTQKLPKTERLKPRIAIEVAEKRGRLSLLPTLVYGDPPSARVDGDRLVHLQGTIPVRNIEAERIQARRLRDELGLSPGRRIELAPEEAILLAARLEQWKGDLHGSGHQAFTLEPELHPQLELSGERIEMLFHSPQTGADAGTGAPPHSDARRATADSVLRAWSSGSSLVRLQGGGYAPLPADWLERFGHRVADLLDARDSDGRVPTSSLPDLAALCEELDQPAPASFERLAPLFADFRGIPATRLPEDLTAELRPYQRLGIDWLAFLKSVGLGALLADDMGLGKTLQALCVLEGRSLVVAPTSLLDNWKHEIERFRPGMDVELYHGAARTLREDAAVTLTSYALMRLDSSKLRAVDWDVIVLDEAQNIKNPQSQVAQAAFALRGQFRIALTGTPVENRLDELWSQLHFLNRGLLGGRSRFRERYERPISNGDASAAQRLRERLRPFVLRRLKRDVAPELPPRTDVVLRFELSDEERAVYRAVQAATVRPVVEQLRAGGGVLAALEALLRLRQAACHPALVPGQQAEGSSKLSLLMDRIDQAVEDGHKALVFSQWTSLLDLVEPHLRESRIPFERLDGSTRKRGAVVDRFQRSEGAPVMLVSLRAGGTGLNLTAADHIFLLDPWWNPAVEDQAADRAHRIGQVRPVVVHRLIAQDTVEERILELHSRKRALSEVALGDAGLAAGLTREDLLALLE